MVGPMKKTIMVLRVDLQCRCCYKKIQKILCKIPEISDRFFDEKANTVTITVISCDPERIRDKLFCKGGKCIKSIEIKEPPKPPPPKPPEKPKEPEKPKPPEKPKEPEKPKPPKPEPHPCHPCCWPCFEGHCGKPCFEGHCGRPCFGGPCRCHHGCGCPLPPQPQPQPHPQPRPQPQPQPHPHPQPQPHPHPHPQPQPQPQPCHDWNYPCGPGFTYGRPCYVSRCDYFSEENTTGCTIM